MALAEEKGRFPFFEPNGYLRSAPNPATGAVLDRRSGEEDPHCCNVEREAD